MTKHFDDFEETIGYHFKDRSLLELALTHTSCEHPESNNQRLEFLGDALLGLVVADALYHKYPECDEGVLDHMRAHIVNGKALADHASDLDIKEYLLVSKAQQQHQPEHSSAMLEDALEALIGAVYLDGGIEAARAFVLKTFKRALCAALEAADTGNPKGRLQELIQQKHAGAIPQYTILSEEGPPHARTYSAAAVFDDKELGRGQGSSKKAAEIAAAERALETLDH